MTATIETALSRPVVTTPGRAARTLASLQTERGYVAISGPPSLPARCRICPMDEVSTWAHRSGRGQGAIYEREEVGHGC